MNYKAKRIASGKYLYRGFIINRIGYYPPEKRVVWEAVDDNGEGFAHGYSLKEVKHWIDNEIPFFLSIMEGIGKDQ